MKEKAGVTLLVLEKSEDDSFSLCPEILKNLEKEAITEVCLFANMIHYNPTEIEELVNIRKTLADKFIKAKCISTPADLAWHIDETILSTFYEQSFGKNKLQLISMLNQFRKISFLLECPYYCRNMPGIVFHHLEQNHNDFREIACNAHWAVETMCKLRPEKFASSKDFAISQFQTHIKNTLQSEVNILEDQPDYNPKCCVII